MPKGGTVAIRRSVRRERVCTAAHGPQREIKKFISSKGLANRIEIRFPTLVEPLAKLVSGDSLPRFGPFPSWN